MCFPEIKNEYIYLLCFYWDLHIKVNCTCSQAFSVNLSTKAGLKKKKASKPLIFPKEKGTVPQQCWPLQVCTACSSDQLTSCAGCDASVFIERSNALVFTEAHLYPRVSFSKTINCFFLNNVLVSGADSGFLCSFCLLKYTVQAVFSVRMEGFYNDK